MCAVPTAPAPDNGLHVLRSVLRTHAAELEQSAIDLGAREKVPVARTLGTLPRLALVPGRGGDAEKSSRYFGLSFRSSYGAAHG